MVSTVSSTAPATELEQLQALLDQTNEQFGWHESTDRSTVPAIAEMQPNRRAHYAPGRSY